MAPVKNDPQADLFRKYIADKRILIADESAVARTSIASMMGQMGAKTALMVLCSNLRDAQQEIERFKPNLVMCDYDLSGGAGLELLQAQRAQNPDSNSRVFVLITGNTSQTAVARAAEEDVDTYILKPFTPATLRAQIIKAVLTKTHPDDYTKTIQEGKKQLQSGQIDDAMKTFESARGMNGTPALACFYLGQTNLMKESVPVAEGSYQEGLGYNKIHYKCLVGLYDVLYSQKRYNEAYEIVKKISQYFPANPQRLTTVLRLAIMTKSYEDVERYYQVFTKIEGRTEETIRYVCAALVVCGKYYLATSHMTRALELFQKAAVTAGGRVKILQEIVMALAAENMTKEATEYMKRFPPETRNQSIYLALDLALFDRSGAARGVIIERARQLLAKDLHDPLIYEIAIRRSKEAGLIPAVESHLDEGCKRYPTEKPRFVKASQVPTLKDGHTAATLPPASAAKG
jgi:two-component system chemotaxis response regulator CheY